MKKYFGFLLISLAVFSIAFALLMTAPGPFVKVADPTEVAEIQRLTTVAQRAIEMRDHTILLAARRLGVDLAVHSYDIETGAFVHVEVQNEESSNIPGFEPVPNAPPGSGQ